MPVREIPLAPAETSGEASAGVLPAPIRVTVEPGDVIKVIDAEGKGIEGAVFLPDGRDLIVVLANGETVALEGFYAHPDLLPEFSLGERGSFRADCAAAGRDHPVGYLPVMIERRDGSSSWLEWVPVRFSLEGFNHVGTDLLPRLQAMLAMVGR